MKKPHRFVVVTNLTMVLVAKARKMGMPTDDDCVLDWVEPDNYAISASHSAFIGAVSDAKSKIGGDYFGCPRIYREEWVESDQQPEGFWQQIDFWEVSDPSDQLSLKNPDHTYEPMED